MLDSGASISVLGKGSVEFLRDNNLKFQHLASYVETTDGSSNKVIGYVRLPVCVKDITRIITFCVVPSFKSSVYLGIDFWKEFDMFPSLAVDEISSVVSECDGGVKSIN